MSKDEVKNFYKIIPKNLLDNNDNPNFPDKHLFSVPHRSVLVGASGGGKTNWVLNYLERVCHGKGTYNSIFYICKDKDEPLLKYIELISPQIRVSEGLETLPELTKFDKKENHLVIIDDLVLAKNQTEVEKYYMMCRKKNVSIIYISQSYYRCPKFIRSNANELILLKLSGDRDIKMILSEGSMGVSKEQLMRMYADITNERFNALIIDIAAPPEKRFIKNFTEIIDVNDYK